MLVYAERWKVVRQIWHAVGIEFLYSDIVRTRPSEKGTKDGRHRVKREREGTEVNEDTIVYSCVLLGTYDTMI